MKKRHFIRTSLVAALVAAMLNAGCGQPPEALLTSAKDYLSKNDKKAAVIQLRNALQKAPNLAEARFLLGRTLLETGEIASAEKELRMAFNLQYPADIVAPHLARAMVALGHHSQVINELANIYVTTPQAQAELASAIGEAHLALGKPQEAQQAFSTALAAEPRYIPAHLGQARLEVRNGKLANAAANIETALRISPGDADALQFKADMLLAQGQTEQALDIYREAVRNKPQLLPAHRAIVLLLLQQNKDEDAEKQFEAMKGIAPNHTQTQYLRALLSARRKNFTEAQQAIQQHLRATPDSLRGLLLAGAIELELKAYAQAESRFLQVIERAPQLSVARRALVTTYLRGGQAGKARDAMKAISREIEKDPALLALAGEVFLMSGEPARAAQHFAKATQLNSKLIRKTAALGPSPVTAGDSVSIRELEQVGSIGSDVRADLALIASHISRREYDQALAVISQLEKKQPGEPLAHHLRGIVLLANLDYPGARRSFEKALESNAAYLPAMASLGQLDFADGKLDTARQRFDAVLTRDPANMQALLGLATLRAQSASRSAPDESIVALFTKAVATQPADPAARLALITYYLGTSAANKALTVAQQAMAEIPDRPEILDAAGRAYYAAGQAKQALAMFKKLASLQPGSPQPYLRMAEVQLAEKDPQDALESLRKALTIRPDLVEAQLGVIAIHVEAGRIDEALRVAREVQGQRRKESIGYIYEGDIYAATKRWAEAANAFRAGLKQVGSSDLATRVHGALTQVNGADAERFANSWLKDRPKDIDFRVYLAQAAAANRDLTAAAQHYRSALEIEPANALVLNNLAWIEGEMKEPKALEHAELANKLSPNHPAIMDTLGMLLIERGNIERGLELLRKASAMAPQTPSIRLNLAKGLMRAGKTDAARKELDDLSKLGERFPHQREVERMRKGL